MGIFEYIAVLTSIIIGLGLTHLLRGVASVIQNPGKPPTYWVHLLWVAYMFFNTVFWWWWEFRLGSIETWTFALYFFVVFYAFLQFLACAMLFPTSFEGYAGYKEYFYSRKTWFFGILAITYLLDPLDTLLKGKEYFLSLGMEYYVANCAQLLLCLIGMFSNNQRFHKLFAISLLAYQVSWALRLFDTVA